MLSFAPVVSAWRNLKTVAAFALFSPLVAWVLSSTFVVVATGMDPQELEKLDPQGLIGVPGVFIVLLMIIYLVGVIPGALAGLAFVSLRGAGSALRFGVCMSVAGTSAGLGCILFGTDQLATFVSGFLLAGAAAGLTGWMEAALGRSSA